MNRRFTSMKSETSLTMDNSTTPSTSDDIAHPGLAKAQIWGNHVSPKKVRNAPWLAELEETKHKLALTSNSVRVTTGIPTACSAPSILKGKLVTPFRVYMRKYPRSSNKKGILCLKCSTTPKPRFLLLDIISNPLHRKNT